ncbi:hypothetical protein GARCT_03309 [Geobacillus sp. 12AMOR1]|nr:hypothetical protein GARCT_03309 [Geobacillus sp. 12AMOR1]
MNRLAHHQGIHKFFFTLGVVFCKQKVQRIARKNT